MTPSSPHITRPPAFMNVKDLAPRPEHVKTHYDPKDVPKEVRDAAEGMESMFLDYMMKVMRQSVPTNEMSLESPATGIYRSMLDSENAKKVAESGGVGLSEQIIDYLMSRNYNNQRGQAVPVEVHGGTHEGQPIRK